MKECTRAIFITEDQANRYASTSHAPIRVRSKMVVGAVSILASEGQNYVEHREGYDGTDICQRRCGHLFKVKGYISALPLPPAHA